MAILNIGASLNTVTTLNNLPVDMGTIYATLSNPSVLSFNEPMYDGQQMRIVISPTVDFILPVPTSNGWFSTFGPSLELKKNTKTLLDITCIGINDYVLKSHTYQPKIYDSIDLGLSSGLLWAKCNIGARNPWDYGKYFQWGDTKGYTGDLAKNNSSWSTCPFNGSSSYNETYFASVSGTVCPNGVLASEYDAATVNMGGSWRMPTVDEFEELYNNTTLSWTTVNNVAGCKFQSKVNNNYIFIPAAGAFYTSGNNLQYAGSEVHVWSSSLYDKFGYIRYAYYLLKYDTNGNPTGSADRRMPMPIRPVCMP